MVIKMFLLLLPFVTLVSRAQSVEVKKEDGRIEGENTTGYQVALAAPADEVRNSFSRYLKNLGRTRQSGDYITLAEPVIGGKKFGSTLYATTKPSGNATSAWVGTRGMEPGLNRTLEKLVYDFGVTFHKEKIQMQIDESMQALQAVEKQQSRLVNQNRDLSNKIENNKREKIALEKALVNNKIELEDLTKKLADNIKAQDSVAIATEQISKVVEMHKQSQRKVQ